MTSQKCVRAAPAETVRDPRNAVQLGGEQHLSSSIPTANQQAHTPRVEPIPLDRIKDGGAQMRVEMRIETINDYAADMVDGAVFPPVILYDDGTDLWLADGFHRVEAVRKIGRETILAEIKDGSARDAVLHGVGSNAVHGLRRTQSDKRRAVERLLKDAGGRAGPTARSPRSPEWTTKRSRPSAGI